VSQSLPNQVNDFNKVMRVFVSIVVVLSQSLPNQVNDFNDDPSAEGVVTVMLSQSLPNQVNDFNPDFRSSRAERGYCVAIPSKPGQRLQ